MNNRARLLDVIDRSLNGPIMSEKDFDMKRVHKNIKRVVKKYHIEYTQDCFLSNDYDLMDRAWDAAVDFLASCGVYSKDTGRVIEYSEREIREIMSWAPGHLVVGEGQDAVDVYHRTLDDTKLVANMGAPVGIPVPEQYFEPVVTSYMQEPLVDIFNTPTVETMRGRTIRTRSPLEVLAGHDEWARLKGIAAKCGRPGICMQGTVISVSDVGHLSSSSWMGKGDTLAVGMICELKVDNTIMNKVADAVLHDKIIMGYADPIYGGLGGGIPGQIVLTIAEMLALYLVMFCEIPGVCPTHPLLFVNDTKEQIQICSVAYGAISRHCNLMCRLTTCLAGGCGTKTLLYEVIAVNMLCCKSGFSVSQGPRPATGVVSGNMSGLEARFQGELIRAAAKIDRQTAENVLRRCYAMYGDMIDQKPYGLPFWEVYDVSTVKPKDFWFKMYEEVKEEAITWGLPMA